jgi:hypothetical protein
MLVLKPVGMGGLASQLNGTGANCPNRFRESKKDKMEKMRFMRLI